MRFSSLVDRRLFGLVDATSVSTSSFWGRVEPRCEEFIISGTLLGPEGSARVGLVSWTASAHEPPGLSSLCGVAFLVGVGVVCGTGRILRTSQWTRASL